MFPRAYFTADASDSADSMFWFADGLRLSRGGGGWTLTFDDYRNRREAERRRRKKRSDEIAAIDDTVTREIAALLQEQERKDADRAHIEHIKKLAVSYADTSAAEINSLADVRSLLRAIERAEEEEFLTVALMVIDD